MTSVLSRDEMFSSGLRELREESEAILQEYDRTQSQEALEKYDASMAHYEEERLKMIIAKGY